MAAQVPYEAPPAGELGELRDAEHLVLLGRAAHRSARARGGAPPSTFDEVVGGLDESNALFEARRCLSCGTCFACDNCYAVCPDNAVIKLDPPGSYAYAFDLDYCKGCGICVEECPAGAIEMRAGRGLSRAQ